MAKIIQVLKVDAPDQCQYCGQYLIKSYYQTFGSDQFDNEKFCSIHCVNQYFDTEKIKNGEIIFKDKEAENGKR